MEITNKERREVATRLRNEIKYMCGKAEWYEKDENPEKCGNKAYRNIAAHVIEGGNFIKGNYIEIVSNLADLIDRPTTTRTCKNPDSNFEKYPCDICGYSIKDKRWNYCPKCGAEIVE